MTRNLLSKSVAYTTLAAAVLLTACSEQADISDNLAVLESQQHESEPFNSALSVSEQAAKQIKVSVEVEHNYTSKGCPNNAQSCYQASMSISLAENMPSNWRIIFSNLSPITKSVSEAFDLAHMNGDMHQITAKSDDLEANTPYRITFYGNTPLVSESVLFPNYLLVDDSGETHVIASTTERLKEGDQVPRPQHVVAFTKPEQQLRSASDNTPIANTEERFARFDARRNKSARATQSTLASSRIIPKMQSAKWSNERLNIRAGLQLPDLSSQLSTAQATSVVEQDSFLQAMNSAIESRFQTNTIPISKDGIAIELINNQELSRESYHLSISNKAIHIEFSDAPGLYYAMMSLAQLYDNKSKSLPIGEAQDSPLFEFRGLHLDVSRNFRSKDFVLKLLEQMSYYKLNKLHLHLADDEGWRLQIASLGELTDVAAFRCFDESEQRCLLPQLAGGDGKFDSSEQNSGYYSTQDYIEILRFAQARQIEVIPSLDMPGHSRAAIVAMNARYKRLMLEEKPEEAMRYFLTELADKSQYRSIQHYNDNTLNPCIPSTYRFVEEVLSQLNAMHQKAGVPLQRYHIGADETAGAWADSPACAQFIRENEDITEVKQLGPYFIERVANMVSELGIIPAAWSDGLSYANADNLPAHVQANAWETLYSDGHNKAHKMINKGWDVVLSTPDVLYFDFPYEADPIEPGYYWGSRYTDSYQVFQFMPQNLPVHAELWQDKYGQSYMANAEIDVENERGILGIQAQLWSETVRSNAQANYMLFPRLLVVAERSWHRPSWTEAYQSGASYSSETAHFDSEQVKAMQNDWLDFSHLLSAKAMPQLVKENVLPRVPLPGAIIEDGRLHMRANFAGLELEYSNEEGGWQSYSEPVLIDTTSPIRVRANIPGTSVYSREQTLAPEK